MRFLVLTSHFSFKNMQAIVIREFGAPEVMKLEEAAAPETGENQILVRVKAAGVNPVDTYIRSGQYASKPNLPFTPGKDAAGIVEKAGKAVKKVKVGDRIFTAGSISGTYAEYALCEENQVWELPDNISFAQGAGVFVPYATAYRALIQKAKAEKGETVLIHGASGGVGIAAIQWAKNAGLRIIGTAGSEKGRKLIKEQGADFALDHSGDEYLEEIKENAGDKGVHIILEMLANENLAKDFEVIEMFGRIVIIGNRGTLEFNPRLVMSKDAAIYGISLFNASPADFHEIHHAIYNGLSEGYLNPVIGKTFSLQSAAQAHHEIIETKSFGKIVLEI